MLEKINVLFDVVMANLNNQAFEDWQDTIYSYIDGEFEGVSLEEATEEQLRVLYLVMINKYKLLK